MNKQEIEIAKGGLMNCVGCNSEGGATKVLVRNNAIIMK